MCRSSYHTDELWLDIEKDTYRFVSSFLFPSLKSTHSFSTISQHLSFEHGISERFKIPYLPPLETRPSSARRPVEFHDGLCFGCDQWIPRALEWKDSTEGNPEHEADYRLWWEHAEGEILLSIRRTSRS